jgi:hypothetical protein
LQKLYVVLTAGFIRVNTEASTQGGPHISHPICARLFELHGNDIGGAFAISLGHHLERQVHGVGGPLVAGLYLTGHYSSSGDIPPRHRAAKVMLQRAVNGFDRYIQGSLEFFAVYVPGRVDGDYL